MILARWVHLGLVAVILGCPLCCIAAPSVGQATGCCGGCCGPVDRDDASPGEPGDPLSGASRQCLCAGAVIDKTGASAERLADQPAPDAIVTGVLVPSRESVEPQPSVGTWACRFGPSVGRTLRTLHASLLC